MVRISGGGAVNYVGRFSRLRLTLGIAVLLAVPGMLAADDDFYLRPSDRVAFYGLDPSGRFLDLALIEGYVATRFPQLAVEFVHGGWGGLQLSKDTAGRPAPDREILDLKPATLALSPALPDFGDAEGISRYMSRYGELIKKIRTASPDLRITLIQPVPSRASDSRPADLSGYQKFHRDLALSEGLQLYNVEAAPPGAGAGQGRTPAVDLLKLWKAPSIVTSVEIDASAKRVIRSENTTVRELEADRVVAWSEDDRALPLPPQLVQAAPALLAPMNIETLKVDSLPAGQFKLTIDGSPMGTFTREQFEEGIDLTALKTPMARQAFDVYVHTLQYMGLEYARWQQTQMGSDPAILEDLQRQVTEALEFRRGTAQLKTHDYEIAPAQ